MQADDGSEILRAMGLNPDLCAGADVHFRPGEPVIIEATMYCWLDDGNKPALVRQLKRFKLVEVGEET